MKETLKCLYCGKIANTKEHVPSKSLLEKPYPSNLITFPACISCNNSFSLDEEYFLNILATLSESQTLIARTQPGGSIFKSRERSDKLYKRILSSFIQEENGKTYLAPETDRLIKVIEKFALGIYYFRYKKIAPIKLFKCVGFYPYNAQESRPIEIILLTHSEKFKLKKWISIQENVFSYIVVRDWRRNNKLTMIFQIHNTAWCVIEIPFPTSDIWNKRNLEFQYKLFM